MSCFLIIFQEVGVMDIPIWLIIPFAGLLLSIAVFPLVKPEWWEKRKPWVVIFWSMLFIIPFAFLYGVQDAAETVLILHSLFCYLDCSAYQVILHLKEIWQVHQELIPGFLQLELFFPAVLELQEQVCFL